MTVTPPKFIAKPLEASVIEKIELSLSQCENIEFREILCPYCSTTLATVTINMREGFIVAKCQKCKETRKKTTRYCGLFAIFRLFSYYILSCRVQNIEAFFQ